MRVPSNSQWTQTNSGSIFGVLHSCYGIQFDEAGVLKLGQRPVIYYGAEQDADFGYLLAIAYYSNTYVFLTDDEMFHGDLNANNLTKLTNANAYGTGSDMLVCYSRLYVTGQTTVDYTTNLSSFSSAGITITTGKHHPMCVFDSQPTYKLAIGNNNTVTLYDSSHAAASDVLTLPAEHEVTSIRYRNGYLYVGTKHLQGSNANVYIWNGSGSAAQYSVDAGSHWVFSMTEYGASVAFINSAGQLQQINGTTPAPLAALPVYYTTQLWQGSTGLNPGGRVFNRGMVSDGQRIFISLNGETVGDQVLGMYSGLWCFDPAVGLYNRAIVPAYRVSNTAPSSLSGNTLTMAADIDAETGDPIHIGNPGSLTGITDQETYYIIKIAANQIQLAQTRADAHNGIPITLGGSVGVAETRHPVLDGIGDLYGSFQGAVATFSPLEQPDKMWGGGILFGGKADLGNYALCALSPAQNVGSFTLQKVFGQAITQTWSKLYTFLSGLHLDNEKIIVKVKTSDKLGLPFPNQTTINWTNTTTFTTTDLSYWASASVGDEVLLTGGTSSLKSCHITSITQGASNFTVVVDEALGVASTSSGALVDNFKKLVEITNTSPDTATAEATVPAFKSPWAMFKIEMRGYEISIPFLEIIGDTFKMK